MRYKEDRLALMRLCVGICTFDMRWQVMPAHSIISLVSTASEPETELTVG